MRDVMVLKHDVEISVSLAPSWRITEAADPCQSALRRMSTPALHKPTTIGIELPLLALALVAAQLLVCCSLFISALHRLTLTGSHDPNLDALHFPPAIVYA
jgi:hypothetical protein